MSLSAYRADAARWDLSLLGRTVELAKSTRADGDIYFDVGDLSCRQPWVLQETAVRGPFPAADRPVWRCCRFPLPSGCASPVWLPAEFELTKEPSSASVVFNGVLRTTVAKALDVLESQCTRLVPSQQLELVYEEPLVRVSLPSEAKACGQRHVTGAVVGPRLRLVLRRLASGLLDLVEMTGGPDGAQEIAAQLIREALQEIDAARDAVAGSTTPGRQHDSKVVAFGRVVQKKLQDGGSGPSYTGATEALALWSAVKQWLRSVRRQPWHWCAQRVELSGLDRGSGCDKLGITTSMKSTNTMKSTGSVATPRHKSRPVFSGDGLLALLRSFDQDGNGFVDWPEFRDTSEKLVSMLGGDAHWSEETAFQEFQRIDCNGNGVIEEDEWLNFVEGFLLALGCRDLERVLGLLGQDASVFSTRLVSTLPGDVDVGLACKRGHTIRPLPLQPWGVQLARSLHLQGGFRCAEIDDPTVFAAARRQRCTRCRSMDSQAAFSVSCRHCASSADAGWWCTRCVMDACSPRNRHGCVIRWSKRQRQGPCKYCADLATVAWPADGDVEMLCNEHAATKLLEEAAICQAASGREPREGPCLAVSCELRLDLPYEDDDGEDLALSLECELMAALAFEGAPPAASQVEVSRVSRCSNGLDGVAVHLELLCASSRPSPYELLLRLRRLIVDKEGLVGCAPESQLELLRTVADLPLIREIVVAHQPESAEMTSRIADVRAEGWPHGLTTSPLLVAAKRQEHLLPSAAVLSLRCRRPPESVGRSCRAHALAYPSGTKKNAPGIQEFRAFFDNGPADAEEAPEEGMPSSASKHMQANQKRASVGHLHGTDKRGSLRGAGGLDASRPKHTSKVKGGKVAEAGCIIDLQPCHSGGMEVLEGRATLFGLKPGSTYDVFVALFPERGWSSDNLAPMCSTCTQLLTASSCPVRSFGLDRDGGVVIVMTEEPNFRRQACFLELLGLSGAPCVIDQHSCALSWKLVKEDKVMAKVASDNGIKIELGAPKGGVDNPALSGGVQLPVPTLTVVPLHLQVKAELAIAVEAKVLGRPCSRHVAAAWRPVVLGLDGETTEAQGCPKDHHSAACSHCKWMSVKHTHNLKVNIVLDIVRMAEIRDLKSVVKRSDICPKAEVRAAVGVMLTTRPMIERDVIMQVFHKAAGKDNDIDFPVRSDGATALHIAVEENQLDAVRWLLSRNMDPSVPNAAQETPLHAAARGGTGAAQPIVELLLGNVKVKWKGKEQTEVDKEAARSALLNASDVGGRTVLHWAALGDQQSLFRYLLKARANPNAVDNAGCSVLHTIAAAGSTSCMALLMALPGLDLNAATLDKRPRAALHCACEQGRWDLCLQLLQRKADARAASAAAGAVPEAEGAHPLALLTSCLSRLGPHAAESRTAVDVARQLLRASKPSRIALETAAASLCDVALWLAESTEAFEATSEVLAMLVEAGVDRKVSLGPALLGAIEGALNGGLAGDRRNDFRIAQANAAGISLMETPDSVRLALRLGADPNAQNDQKDTALHLLLRFPSQCRALPSDMGCGEAVATGVRLLVEHKASLKLKNCHGETPLSIARELSDHGEYYGKSWLDVLSGCIGFRGGGGDGSTKCSSGDGTSKLLLPVVQAPVRMQLPSLAAPSLLQAPVSASPEPMSSTVRHHLGLVDKDIDHHGKSKATDGRICQLPDVAGGRPVAGDVISSSARGKPAVHRKEPQGSSFKLPSVAGR